jgi:hypothetical protein
VQVFLYEACQLYEENHEYIEVERMRYSGVWILTVFVYMNMVKEKRTSRSWDEWTFRPPETGEGRFVSFVSGPRPALQG